MGLRVVSTFAYAPIDAVTCNVISQWVSARQIGTALAVTFTGFQLGPFCLLMLSGECSTVVGRGDDVIGAKGGLNLSSFLDLPAKEKV